MKIIVKRNNLLMTFDNDTILAEPGKIHVGTVRSNNEEEAVMFGDHVYTKEDVKVLLQATIEEFIK